MVMNKKGFLKILEAIVAILIVLGFIVAIIPEKPAQQAGLPPDLEQTTNAILKELQETPEFRACILEATETNYVGIGGTGAECVYNYINFITRPPELHPWKYAARVCTASGGEFERCVYYGPDPANPTGSNVAIEGFSVPEDAQNSIEYINTQISILSTNIGKNIYIRSITITVEDVLGEGLAGDIREILEEESEEPEDESEPPYSADESNINPGTQRIITIFAWSKR